MTGLHEGLVLAESVQENISLPSLDRLSVLGLVTRGREATLAADGSLSGNLLRNGAASPITGARQP